MKHERAVPVQKGPRKTRKGVDRSQENVLDVHIVAEQRKTRRFELKLPVELLRSGSRQMSQVSETRNVSSGGVLLSDATAPLNIGQPVEYLISLPTGRNTEQVRLHCMGKVIRLDEDQNTIAMTLERYEFVRAHTAV